MKHKEPHDKAEPHVIPEKPSDQGGEALGFLRHKFKFGLRKHDVDRFEESGAALDDWLATCQTDIRCGAKTRSGKPCRGRKMPGKNRCAMHGGLSTGPKTAEGKKRALANLKYMQPK